MIVGRISMGQVPTDSGEVTHERVANDSRSIAHNRYRVRTSSVRRGWASRVSAPMLKKPLRSWR